jgi:MscS family membrane protein
MKDFFSKEFYGNTLDKWLIALFIILGSIIIGRIIYWFFSKILRILTRRTKTKLDDIIIDKVEEPIVVAIVIAGIWYGLTWLYMDKNVGLQVQGIIQLLIIMDVAWVIVRTVDALIEEYIVPVVEKSENNLDDAILPIARRGFSIVVWVVAVVVGLNNAGYDVATILAGLGIGGLAFAIGARSTIMNMFGGLNVLVTQPFKINDRILIDDHDGYVEKIGLSTTRIRTFLDNFLVTVPNKIFTDKEVVNISAAPGFKVEFLINLPIEIDPMEVQDFLDFLSDLALTHPFVDRDCKVTLKGANDFALVIQFIYYIKQTAPFWDTQSEVNLAILKHLKHKKIKLATRNSLNFVTELETKIRDAIKNPELHEVLREEDEF